MRKLPAVASSILEALTVPVHACCQGSRLLSFYPAHEQTPQRQFRNLWSIACLLTHESKFADALEAVTQALGFQPQNLACLALQSKLLFHTGLFDRGCKALLSLFDCTGCRYDLALNTVDTCCGYLQGSSGNVERLIATDIFDKFKDNFPEQEQVKRTETRKRAT